MNKKNPFFILLAVTVLGVLFWSLKFQSQDAPLSGKATTQEEKDESEKMAKDEMALSKPSGSEESLSHTAANPSEKVDPAFLQKIENFKPASLQKLQEEVAQNPHTAPPSGLASALDILELSNSIRTQEEAHLFLKKMKDCAGQNADTSVAVKSTCLKHSRRLLERFPEMKPQVEEIISISSERAVQIERKFQN